MERQTILTVSHLQKYYGARESVTRAIDDLSFTVDKGEFVGIMGASGSGKTTLLNCVATIDRPTAGHITIGGADVTALRRGALAKFRRERLGFVFQDCNLLDTFTLRDNIVLPLVLSGRPYAEMEGRLQPLAARLEIGELLDKYPYEVSGGQKQRAAAARAMITEPRILLADEPTGALDSRAADGLLTAFAGFNGQGQTILMVTHSVRAASRAGRVLFLKDGTLYHQLYRGDRTDGQFYEAISDTLTVLATGGVYRG